MVSPVSDPASLQGEDVRQAAAGDRAPERLEEAASSWSKEVGEIWAALTRSLDLQRRALGLRLFDAAWRTVIAAMGAVVVIVAAACAALLLVAGARRGLAAWTADAWWSDLLLGGVLAAGLCIALYSLQRAVHRNALKHVQRKLSPGAADPAQAR